MTRAKKLGFEFNIELQDIVIPEFCPILGVRLKLGVEPGAPKEDWYARPSLDRIDNRKGYVKGNVWVVSWRANCLKRNATVEELQRLASALSDPETHLTSGKVWKL